MNFKQKIETEYKEYLNNTFSIEKVYVISNKVEEAKIKPYLITNGMNQLTIMIFSDEETAIKTSKSYHLMENDKEILIELSIEELIDTIEKYTYKGLEIVSIYMGDKSLSYSVENVLNAYADFSENSKSHNPKLIRIIMVLNYILRKNCDLYVIPKEDTKYVEILSRKFNSIIELNNEERILPIFINKNIANKYGISNNRLVNSSPYNILIDKYELYELITNNLSNVDKVHIYDLDMCHTIEINKLLQLINDFNFYEKNK